MTEVIDISSRKRYARINSSKIPVCEPSVSFTKEQWKCLSSMEQYAFRGRNPYLTSKRKAEISPLSFIDFDLDYEQQMIDECANYDYVSPSSVCRKRKATGDVFENKSPIIASFDDSIDESAMIAICEAKEIAPPAFDESIDESDMIAICEANEIATPAFGDSIDERAMIAVCETNEIAFENAVKRKKN